MIAQTFLLLAASLAQHATAATIEIDVGEKGLTFDPASVTAAVGDILEFHFYPGPHSVAMSDFSNPCQPAASGGFYSGFVSTTSGEASFLLSEQSKVFRVMVNSTSPMFFYCSATGHCPAGMVGAVNPGGSQTLDAYTSAAKGASGSSSPPSVFGGVLADDSSSTSTSASAGGSTSTATSTSTSAPTTTSASSGGGGGGYGGGGSGSGTTTNGAGAVGVAAGTLFVAVGAAVLGWL